VRKTLSIVLAVGLLSVSAFAWTSARQSAQAPTITAKPNIEDVLKTVRADLQGQRADIMAKNITLTADQAAKFWPIYQKFQEEQNLIMDDQLKYVQQYVSAFDKLDDAGALAFIQGHFDRDARMNALRQKWLASFREVLPTKLAVRVIQIDRRLSLMQQMAISSEIPLVH
jgi:Spy/CpxP family protein refolding chaperone